VVVFLPISRWDKAGVAVGLAAISWSMFLVGSVLVGKKGLTELRQWLSSRRLHAGLELGSRRPQALHEGPIGGVPTGP
jgi:hypothetical protein